MCPVSTAGVSDLAFYLCELCACLLNPGSLIIQYQLDCHSLFCFDGWLLALGGGVGDQREGKAMYTIFV